MSDLAIELERHYGEIIEADFQTKNVLTAGFCLMLTVSCTS